MKTEAVVVLGCRISSAEGEPLAGAAGRRARAAAEATKARAPSVVVAAGGRAWAAGSGRRVEADALADELAAGGVTPAAVVRERCSRNTRENARFVARILAERGVSRVVLVTCAWHLPRAAGLFRREGLEVEPWPAAADDATLRARAYRVVRERVAARLDRLFGLLALALLALLVGCGHARGGPDASDRDAGGDGGADLATLEKAEDMRRADLVTDALVASSDGKVRRRAARALARIGGDESRAGLLRALGDEDAETVAWGAYGLGFWCKGREEATVRALAARAASLDVSRVVAPAGAELDPHAAIARALGRCGGALAESTLAAWVRGKGKSAAWREQAAYALGDVGARRGSLDDDTVTALLDAAGEGVAAALYPFARVERFNDAFDARLLDAAKKIASGTKSDERVFAVRALAKGGDLAVPELSRVATSADFTWAERIDAMRSLGKCGEAGRAAVAVALASVAPNGADPFSVLAAGGDAYGEIVVGLTALGQRPPASATRLLQSLANLRAAGAAPPSLARRLANVRCTAASLLARGAYDAQVIRACDAPGGEALERARLSALLRRSLVGARRGAWVELTKSAHLRVREAALTAFGAHHELAETGLSALAAALRDTKHPGVVATAAAVLYAHPELALVLSAKERRNALDPNAPPPTANPAREVSPTVAKALGDALAFAWSEDAIETRAGLLDAAVVLHLHGAKAAAKKACADPNVTMRDHGLKALRDLGDEKASCPEPKTTPLAKETAAPHGGTLVLDTDAGTLSITFDPGLAPVASSRILDLAKAGFYEGTVVHRVVPGFVVQLGDPQGDGYGGSGQTLRCETSPVPFGPLDVGIALAGRDTGSSQFFVALGRFPHLDGDYARVGHASGDWFAVAEGDVVDHARVQ